MTRKRGHPSLLTDDVARRICDYVRAGNHADVAGEACGVARTTLLGWLKEGAAIRRRLGDNAATAVLSEHRRRLVDFSTNIEKALAEAEARDVMLISKASQGDGKRAGDWRASAWLLERRNKARWSERTEVTGADGGPVAVAVDTWANLALLAEAGSKKASE